MEAGTILPLGLWVSAGLAALPIVTIFVLLSSRRLASHQAALVGSGLAALLALTVWRFPLPSVLAAAGHGLVIALFPITYIIAASLLLYNLTVVSGWAERLRSSLVQTIPDRYLLLLLIGFGFAAFLDSTAGFLTPVTVATAVLVGVGIPAFEAAAYTLVASSLPPIFGAMGIPIVVLAEVTGLPLPALVERQAVIAGLLFLGFPTWLTLTFGGWPAVRRLWRHTAAAGLAYAVVIWWVATRISPYPAALAASVAALLAVALVARWQQGSAPTGSQSLFTRQVLGPWWPYLLLILIVILWSQPLVSQWLNKFTIYVAVPALAPAVLVRLEWLVSPGTAILFAGLIFGLVIHLSLQQWGQAVRTTACQLRYPLVSMLAMLALAQIMNFSGMTPALGEAVAGAGATFPLVSPYLSWLGAAITGSNTAANVMLGRLQVATAVQLGLDPLLVVALAGAAAPLGKMVAPQVIAAAVGVGELGGSEGRLLRVGLFHSLIWAGLIALAGWLLALSL